MEISGSTGFEEVVQKESEVTLTSEEYEALTEMIQDEANFAIYSFKVIERMKEIMNEAVKKTFMEITKPSIILPCTEDLEYRPLKVYEDGRKYFGQWDKITNQREGMGISINSNEQVAMGKFTQDEFTGKGLYIYSNGSYYEGDLKNRYADGFGKIVSVKGYTYEGQWENDQRNGFGILKTTEGEVYEGNFVNHCREGYGKFLEEDGEYYEGEFKESMKHGYGVSTLKEGTEIFCEFSEDEINGVSSIIKPDGSMFYGEWDRGEIINGIYTDPKGKEMKVPDEVHPFEICEIFEIIQIVH
ncbi:unnamed protein product [Moneuplotes crassus]|uniref:MORN repeat-containing protein n=1 Tax=Euplotes crassus TaxID=5936 RepID=A0AAD2D246_EUPCR|nr:unnamed protein product [Moneuplotes crassus]